MSAPAHGPIPEAAVARLREIAGAHDYPLLFATVSGAHLYGFASPDSDFDLRGAHVLPVREVVGLEPTRDTIEVSRADGGLELDLVTHDARKFFTLLLKRNGYVLEQLLSPLVVLTTAEHEELRSLAPRCLTRHHVHHYRGFVQTQWKLFEKERPPRVKPLLYVYRVLLTGIHLMRTGVLDASLPRLNEVFRLPYVPELIARKVGGAEKSRLDDVDLELHRAEVARLAAELEEAGRSSRLPDAPSAAAALGDLLVRIRLSGLHPSHPG